MTWTVCLVTSLVIEGLLIDSERVYTQVLNSVLAAHGKGPMTAEVKANMMGSTVTVLTNTRATWNTRIFNLYDSDVGDKGCT